MFEAGQEFLSAAARNFPGLSRARRAGLAGGKDPEPPAAGPKDGDQVNLTDEESRIMPVSGGGFEQSYNAQAGVDTETMMVITRHVSQACNDKREVLPTLEQIQALPAVLGEAQTLITDNGFFSQANVIACNDAGVEPLLALKRQSHHMPVLARFAADEPEPQTTDPVVQMAHRLGTQAGRVLYGLRKQTVEPVFGIITRVMGWRQMSMRGLNKAQGEWSLVTMAQAYCTCVWNETPEDFKGSLARFAETAKGKSTKALCEKHSGWES